MKEKKYIDRLYQEKFRDFEAAPRDARGRGQGAGRAAVRGRDGHLRGLLGDEPRVLPVPGRDAPGPAGGDARHVAPGRG